MQKRVQIKILTDSYALLKKAQSLTQEGKAEMAEDLFGAEIARLEQQLAKVQNSALRKGISPQAGKLIQMEQEEIIYEDDSIKLIPIKTEALAAHYLEVRIENAVFPSLFNEEITRKNEVDEVFEEKTFYCGIISREADDFVGYCGINDIYAKEMELAVAILKRHQHKGYGSKALRAFMATAQKVAGVNHFIVKVDPENKASRQLMIRLGFKPSGIDTYMIDDEDKLHELEEENIGYITDDLVGLAREFNVEPRSLLSHILVYSLDCQ